MKSTSIPVWNESHTKAQIHKELSMQDKRRNLVLRALASLCAAFVCGAAVASDPVDFRQQIAPIFERHCVRCHSPRNNKGDVSLATFDDLKSNDFVTAGDPGSSYLIELVTSQDGEPPVMPKEGKSLSDARLDRTGYLISPLTRNRRNRRTE